MFKPACFGAVTDQIGGVFAALGLATFSSGGMEFKWVD